MKKKEFKKLAVSNFTDPVVPVIYGEKESLICVLPDDAQELFKTIASYINRNMKVVLSFKNIVLITPTFLNIAIGQLYGSFSEETIREYLTVIDMEQDDLQLLLRVVDTAKLFFKEHSC